ncbi:MAG: IclR family transcriptional regulator [Sneathiella sp.]|nr:IclR family transcriptional regulator [Sneathiella sp.]
MATPVNNSVVKSFAILDIFDDHRDEITTLDVVTRLGFNTVTAHRFLKTLVHVGALISPHKGVYRLGFKLVDYGVQANSSKQLAFLLQPFLNALAAQTNEGAMATVFDGSAVTCIATAYSDQAFVFNARVGARHEAYATANGKIWLANIGPDRLESYLVSNELLPLSENTLTDREALLNELEKVRNAGYATNHSERETGLHAIAVPVFSRTGEMVAGVSVFAPAQRMDPENEKNILEILMGIVKRVQSALYGAS